MIPPDAHTGTLPRRTATMALLLALLAERPVPAQEAAGGPPLRLRGTVERAAEIPGRPVVAFRRTDLRGDDDLGAVASLTDLRTLDLAGAAITDEGVRRLERLIALRTLVLARTRVTDAGLLPLLRLVNLETLDLAGTGVTREGVERFRGLHPSRTLAILGGPFPRARGADDQVPWPEAPPAAYPGREVVVYYGTNREAAAEAPSAEAPAEFFLPRRGPLRFGYCRVGIPEGHKVGGVERPWSLGPLKFPEDPRKHFVLRRLDVAPRDEFFATLKAAVDRAGAGEKSAFVFIHGFNVPFADAVYRTAQLAADLDFGGPALLFSWPTQGRLEAYLGDAEAARLSAPAIEEFLDDVARESGADRIHLIAHSMGNLALTGALTRSALERRHGRGPRFDQILLAAPDIDAEVFREEIAPHLGASARRTTLYASGNDRALASSRALRDKRPRIGEDVLLARSLSGLDAVDASGVDTSFLGHSYFGDRSELLGDIEQAFRGRGPGDRGLRRMADGTYWAFGAGPPPGRSWWPVVAAVVAALIGVSALFWYLRRARRRVSLAR